MSCEDHHTGMNYVQVEGKEPFAAPWCFTCNRRSVLRIATAAKTAKEESPDKVTKRTPRSANGVRGS